MVIGMLLRWSVHAVPVVGSSRPWFGVLHVTQLSPDTFSAVAGIRSAAMLISREGLRRTKRCLDRRTGCHPRSFSFGT
jgi:hypothetical protein